MKFLLPTIMSAMLVSAPLYTPSAYALDAEDGKVIGAVLNHVFSKDEKSIIEDYYKNKSQDKKDKHHKKAKKDKDGLPPGLAKRDELPPGLQKHLEKNGTLPPGLEKRALPSDLQRKLPKLLGDLERVIVGDDVVLIDKTRNVVLDVLENILTQ